MGKTLGRSLALCAAALMGGGLLAGPATAQESVKMGAFQGTFINFPIYVAHDLGLFEKHGVDVELVYGKGIQVTNMVVSGATEFGGFAVEHGLSVIGKGQDLKLLVLNQTQPPYDLIVANSVDLPNADKPYPENIADLKGLKLGISTPGASSDQTLRFLLSEAGLDPQSDVTLVPAGEPTTQIAGLKNGTIDGTLAFEPIQTEAVRGQKIAKSVLDIQGGEGPEVLQEFAFNGIFTSQAYLEENPDVAKAVVDAIVEAEEMINDPDQTDKMVEVAGNHMRGIAPELVKAYLEEYRSIFRPIATEKAIENVNKLMLAQDRLQEPLTYETVVATEFMPDDFAAAETK